jgi:hypothetical protein
MDVIGKLHAPAALLLVIMPPTPIGQEVWWALELVWMLRRREKSLAPTGNQILVIQLITGLLY